MNATVETKQHFQSRWSEVMDAKFTLEESTFNFLVPKTVTYYRSKAFVSQIGINPLIAASAPLFFLIEKIQTLAVEPDIEKLHQDLIHEINAFEHQAGANGYRPYIVIAARYVLCSWIDQTILNTSWAVQNQSWTSLTDPVETEKESPFFLLINRCLQEPSAYIDLLELFYLCLSLGFTGNNPSLELNKTKIAETRDYLFEVINKQHESYSKRLEIDVPMEPKKKRFSMRPWVRLSLSLLGIVLLVNTYWMLNKNLEAPITGNVINAAL